MSEFHVLAISICFILGGGILTIPDGVGTAIHGRKQASLFLLIGIRCENKNSYHLVVSHL